MKKLSIALVAGLLIVASCKSKKTTTEAAADATAPTEEVRTQKPQRGGGSSLEDRLAKQEEMYTQLGLSDDQKVQFRAIETKYADKMRDAKESTSGNRDAMRTAMNTIQDDKLGEISNILRQDQFVKYKEELSKMREGRRP